MQLYQFQQNAIKELLEKFKILWANGTQPSELVFKSPTGSGKTFMMANFVNQLVSQPDWQQDVCFVWITCSDDLAMQSRESFQNFFFPNTTCRMLTVADFKEGILQQNDILFLNWQKLVATNAADRVLRRPDDTKMSKESGYYFEDVVENTKNANREIILIIDESHLNVSDLAKKTVINTLKPHTIIKVSATPFKDRNERGLFLADVDDGKAGLVEVNHADVVAEGLIKEQIVTQTEEDVKQYVGHDQDEMLLELAIKKREELRQEYDKYNLGVNPLVLIQLPNDDSELRASGEPTKEEIVRNYLINVKQIPAKRITSWFKDKKPDPFIAENDCEIDFMLFKQAAGTGWDCPRAHVLVMFREIKGNTFYTQTLGRILRIPKPQEIKPLKSSLLKTGFLYTNYTRAEVAGSDSPTNKPSIYKATLKYKDILLPDCLLSDFESRVDYGDLADAAKFQESLIKSFNNFFGITNDLTMYNQFQEKVKEKGIDLNPQITNSLVIDGVIKNIDNLGVSIPSGSNISLSTSGDDLDKIFTHYCLQLLQEQTSNDTRISNISRSWSPLKTALRTWLRANVNPNTIICYRVFIYDVNKGANSVFRQALTQALKDYRPILDKILETRSKNSTTSFPFKFLNEYYYTNDYEELDLPSGNCVLTPFYIKKEYKGKKNEEEFIQFIDSIQEIKWWFKNGDYGQDYLAFRYFNTVENKWSLFYPDWLIQMKDGRIGIFDTKAGMTASDQSTKDKAEALQKRIEEMNQQLGEEKFFGGIVVKENYIWFYSDAKNYNYTKNKLDSSWKFITVVLDDLSIKKSNNLDKEIEDWFDKNPRMSNPLPFDEIIQRAKESAKDPNDPLHDFIEKCKSSSGQK